MHRSKTSWMDFGTGRMYVIYIPSHKYFSDRSVLVHDWGSSFFMTEKEYKAFEIILQHLHGEYEYDPVVSEETKQWWRENAYRYLVGYLKFYSRFDPEVVQEFGL